MASGQSRVVSMQYVNQKRWLLKYEISLFGFGQVIWGPPQSEPGVAVWFVR